MGVKAKMATEQEIDQSYETINWLTVSMQKVGSNPNLLGKFLYNYNKRLPEIVDAIMLLIPPEHRGVVADLLKATGKMSSEVLVWTTKKK